MRNELELSQLRQEATALRLAGKSLREIKEITGVTSNRVLGEALRGVPPQPWTRRPRAKDDMHAKARELRSRGRTPRTSRTDAETTMSRSSTAIQR
jgi:hypothetical protein